MPRQLRRQQLALRFIERGVRTETISRWTGLTKGAVTRLCAQFEREFPGVAPPRLAGQSPWKLRVLMRRAGLRSELAAIGAQCRAWGVIPAVPRAALERALPGIVLGEKLCRLFDAHREVVTESEITLETVLATAVALATDASFDIQTCACGSALLMDRLELRSPTCMHCRRSARLDREAEMMSENGAVMAALTIPEQPSLF